MSLLIRLVLLVMVGIGMAIALRHHTNPSEAAIVITATRAAIHDMANRVSEWQLAHMNEYSSRENSDTRGWVQASFYIGLSRWSFKWNPKFSKLILNLGEKNLWRLGDRLYNADDHAIGQVYVAAYDSLGYVDSGDTHMIAPLLAQFDRILARKPDVSLKFDDSEKCQERWCWCDALFMAPPAWMAVSRITGKKEYRDYADGEFWATADYLFDRSEHLFFRDSRFFDRRDSHGEKIFWGRGNGWVFAALVNILRELPQNDRSRARYQALFIEMAEKLLTRQRPDGFWATSLMAPLELSTAESSATAFITYGMSSGVVSGLLDRERFEPAAMRGWRALVEAVNPEGRLGRVQQIGDAPDSVDINHSQLYGSGGLLLAATSMISMAP